MLMLIGFEKYLIITENAEKNGKTKSNPTVIE